ncbi:L,D-transpeptidase [Nocardioides sp. YIM 152315]|uniref:L,D-transpeptidase n=1 Tax=Nocardioides sp. YIM 152315 TaxID=3031760 RepID=UPI0023DBC803|nr:L,D-transpeptidase [Nocardioides sp. YIM 152315]MDF1602989.1 L,D-transpeptidase [Nocardioides sp. YIM 152315]
MTRHRAAPVRPRYGRLAALGSSLAVTGVAVLGSFGVLPGSDGGAAAEQKAPALEAGAAIDRAADGALSTAGSPSRRTSADAAETAQDPARDTSLPAASGTGRRVVFSQDRQRVWLVTKGTKVERTYLVSGSVYDNLEPGTYQVYSRSQQAWGIDDSGSMRFFVRFAQGDRAAIGFHDIPVDDGEPVQTVAQLGTPLSHGCIRQKESDAIALWNFAPLGTNVVVTA